MNRNEHRQVRGSTGMNGIGSCLVVILGCLLFWFVITMIVWGVMQ